MAGEERSNDRSSSSPSWSTTEVVTGILFSRSVRSNFCGLSLVPLMLSLENTTTTTTTTTLSPPVVDAAVNIGGGGPALPILVRIQFFGGEKVLPDLRSFCRRYYKLGDVIKFRRRTKHGGSVGKDSIDEDVMTPTMTTVDYADTKWKQPRWVVNITSSEAAKEYLTVVQSQYWNMAQCQQWQRRFFSSSASSKTRAKQPQPSEKRKMTRSVTDEPPPPPPPSSSSFLSRKENPNCLLDLVDPKNDATAAASDTSTKMTTANNNKNNPHGGGLGKRVQGEHIAKFLIASIMHKLSTTPNTTSPSLNNDNNCNETGLAWFKDPSTWSTWDASSQVVLGSTYHKQAIEYLNSGSGVLDVAGGSGHVSMALGMMGVKSTVVDARESVGKLPGKDRKIWKRALITRTTIKNNNNKGSSSTVLSSSNNFGEDEGTTSTDTGGISVEEYTYCLPVVVPYQAYRAWFGVRPTGVDSTFRHADQDTLPLCDETSDLLVQASAIVALHPDEATGDIVQVAVRQQTPLVVVPCCVFARLFPNRKMISNIQQRTAEAEAEAEPSNKVVSSYDDLLTYLARQDPRISQAELPFDGKNTVLWSTFD